MSDNIVQVVQIEGEGDAAVFITKVNDSLKTLVASLKETQATMRTTGRAWTADLDKLATDAKAATTGATRAFQTLRETIAAEARSVTIATEGMFVPLSEGAATSTKAASTSMTAMTATIREEMAGLRTTLATAFEPIVVSVSAAADSVKAGAASMSAALDAVIAQARTAAAEMKSLAVPVPAGVPGGRNNGLRNAANRGGRHGPHFRAAGVPVPGGHVSLGSTPVMGAAAVGGYAVWEAMKAQDEALKLALTSPGDAAQFGSSPEEYQRRIMSGSALTGFDIGAVAEALRASTRATQGLPADERTKLVDALLPKAAAEARLKGATLSESMEALIGLNHMVGSYDVESAKTRANKFSIASLGVNANLPELSRTLGYSLPTLHAGLGIDEDTIIALTSALHGAGITSTRSGTWVRSFFQGALRNGSEKHDNALAALGLGDRKDWEVVGSDGQKDWGRSTDRIAEIIRQRTAGMSEEDKAKNLHAAFGERGSSVAALLTQKGIQDQFDGIRSKITGGSEIDLFKQYSEGSSLMQAQTTWRDTQNLLIDIGTTALPKVNEALRDFDQIVKDLAAAANGDWSKIGKTVYDHTLKSDVDAAKRVWGTPTPDDRSDRARPGDGTESWSSWFARKFRQDTADVMWDDGSTGEKGSRSGLIGGSEAAGDAYDWTTALQIWSQQALDLAEIKKVITGPEITTLKAIEADLQTLGAGIVAALSQAMGGVNGTAGAIQASFETGDGTGTNASGLPGFNAGGKASPGRWWTPERMAHAKSRLMKEAGLSEHGADALVARWSSVEAPGGPQSVNPKSGAAGIGQWLGNRRRGFGGDFDPQIGHAVSELNRSESRAGNLLRQAQNAEQGAVGASAYERAERYNPRTGADAYTAKTIRAAKAVHDAIRGTAPPKIAPAVPTPAETAERLHGSTSKAPVHHHHGDIVVNGAGDPEAVAQKVIATIDRKINRHSSDVYTDI